MLEKFIAYYRDNPEGYWFKRKLFGWGWVPVKWQGWFVMLIGAGVIAGGVYVGDTDDAPGAALFGIVLGLALIFGFAFWKGEKPRWQWGLPKDGE